MFQLSKLLSREDHPWRKFGSGNKESLLEVGLELEKKTKESESPQKALQLPPSPDPSGTTTPVEEDGGVAGRETRRKLVEWYEQQYCASRMKVVILGKGELSCDGRLVRPDNSA